MKNNKELKQATKKLEEISQDEHMQRIAEWREKAILDENTARVCGYDDGKKDGKLSEKKEIAKHLLKMGMCIDDISKATKLTIAEIQKINM